jgi:2-hydroxy-3-oxopropionate reductase
VVNGLPRVGFIGLGIMGSPMAANLVKAGYDVIGYSRGRAGLDRLVAAGGRAGASVAELTREADVVITMLPDSPDVEQVTQGEHGIFETAGDGLLYLDMSSIRPQTAVAVAAAAAARGLGCLDAPVSGGQQGAIDGSLSIMVGGGPADFQRARPLLDVLGSTVVYVGPAGCGQTVKAANQLVVAGVIEVVAEALVLLEASGVDAEAGLTVLAGGLAGNRILDHKRAGMLARDFRPGFRIDLHHKDMGIVLAAAREAGVTVPVGALLAQLLVAARARGDGSLDHTALLRLVERLSGRGVD